MRTTIFLLLAIGSHFSTAQSPLAAHYNEAKEAHKRQDYQGYLLHTLKADSISPNHPTLTYNLASAYALTGDHGQSLATLKRAVLMNTSLYPANDTDFQSVEALPAFREVTDLKNMLLKNIAKSEVAFTVDEKDLHPESIAYDPVTKSFLMSSVHKNKIISYNTKTGKTTDWKKVGEDGLWAVMGMRRDAKRKALWVCTVVTKEMDNYQEELEGKTALLKYDLATKKLLKRYELSEGHWFGDLVLGQNGIPYISDSKKPIIYTVKDDKLEVFKDFSEKLFNLQGLAFDDDQKMLYIADYKLGLYVYGMSDGLLKKLHFPDHVTTKGIDGLYYYHGRLIAIHNGVNPLRVCEYQLDDLGTKITDVKYLDRGRVELGEPTLGVIARGSFYYIANSPKGKYDKEGNLKVEELVDNVVLRYDLKE